MNFSREKALVRAHQDAQITAPPDDLPQVLGAHMSDDCIWRGYRPFYEQSGAGAVARVFWQPLRQSLKHLQRREDIFFAGANELDGFQSRWVVSMGHLVGLFDEPWLGIPPTGRMAFLRYCAFYRVDGDKIRDVAMYIDIPHLMLQAGLTPFPAPGNGAQLVQPGPMGGGGLLTDDQPPEEGQATLAAINAMINDLGTWQSGLSLENELRQTWVDDMIWWGPSGIGATYTIDRYAQQHSGPFRAAFSERSKTAHVARLAEGRFGGFFGWPNFTATLSGDFMGFPATGKTGDFRVIDIYRRDGDKLAENWVFIDLPHFWHCQGIDILPKA